MASAKSFLLPSSSSTPQVSFFSSSSSSSSSSILCYPFQISKGISVSVSVSSRYRFGEITNGRIRFKNSAINPLISNSRTRRFICRAAEYKFPDPIPEFAEAVSKQFRNKFVRRIIGTGFN